MSDVFAMKVEERKRSAEQVNDLHGVAECLHCGTVFPRMAVQGSFCCSGCEFVHNLINENGLSKFYELKDRPIAPVNNLLFDKIDFRWLEKDVTRVEEEALDAGSCAELSVGVHGLSCVACVWLIENCFLSEKGSIDIDVNVNHASLVLRWEPEVFDAIEFFRKIGLYGYAVSPVDKNGGCAPRSDLKLRLGLCGAFAMNAMLFTIPSYLGMSAQSEYHNLFVLLSMLFATCSLMVGGSYFFKRSWLALKSGTLHLDLPISIGVLAAYLGSLAGWLTGSGDAVYFDFVATFILLMLLGRLIQEMAVNRTRQRIQAANPASQTVLCLKSSAMPVQDGESEFVEISVQELKKQDTYKLNPDRPVPVDSVLAEGNSFSYEWITGESDIKVLKAGDEVVAGAINVGSKSGLLTAEESWETSFLAQLSTVDLKENGRNRKFEWIIKIYLCAVMLIALAGFLAWAIFMRDLQSALQVAISILVVSCPCAIGLALPLTDEVCKLQLQKAGIILRNSHVWQKMKKIKRVVFDKTGTLTNERPTLCRPEKLRDLNDEERSALYVLVSSNSHPVSCSVKEALLTMDSQLCATLPKEDVEEVVGYGLKWRANATIWTLSRPDKSDGMNGDNNGFDVKFCKNGSVVCCFAFKDSLRRKSEELVQALRKMKIDTYILSGDRRSKVEGVAEKLGIPYSHTVSACTPDSKEAWIHSHEPEHTLMLGDGANDIFALNASCLSGAPVSQNNLAEKSADFLFFGNSIKGVYLLFKIAGKRYRVTCRIFAFSIFYNLVAVGLCLAGVMNPLLAAILMPISALITMSMVFGLNSTS